MLRFLGFLFLLSTGVGTWGWCRGWFTVDVNREVMASDLVAFEQKVHEALAYVDDKITSLRDRARTANAKSKPELEREIQELEAKRNAASESLEALKNAPPEEQAARKRRLEETIEPLAPKNEPPAPKKKDSAH